MMIKSHSLVALVLALGSYAIHTPAIAQSTDATPSVNWEFGVPVTAFDITDRHYTVLGEVKAGVRKATIISKTPDQGKVYRELWERAKKLGADAVIKASYGDPKITAFSWGSISATGLAVKFNAPATESVGK